MLLHRGPLSGGDQALELAAAHALVRRASAGEVDEVLRVYRPSAPVAVSNGSRTVPSSSAE